jgi:hypothetical protein
MKDIQRQLEVNSLSPWIADVIAPYNEKAGERVRLKKIPAESQSVVDELLGY